MATSIISTIFGSKKEHKALERSVDSLKNIYTIIIALAIGNSINKLFSTNVTDYFSIDFANKLLVLLAFFVTVVPFFHGMNRHLDECYINKNAKAQGFLLFDFLVFCFEAIIFVAFANRYTNGLEGYYILALLLSIDAIWSVISHIIHYSIINTGTFKWVFINFFVLLIGCIMFWFKKGQNLIFLFSVLAIIRTVLDYIWCWKYYFPDK